MKASELFKLLKKDGWFEIRQTGSHVFMLHPTKRGNWWFRIMEAKKYTPGF